MPIAPSHLERRRLLLLVLILSATFVVYLGSLNFQFVYDDESQIVANPLIREAHWVPRYFRLHVWSHTALNAPGNYYRPIFLLWLFCNYRLFGLNAAGWHLNSILLHLAATTLVFLLARKLSRDPPIALLAAALFGLHPVHIESVAWVSGVTESLLAISFLGSLLCYIQARERHSHLYMAFSLALYALTLLSKETALVLPLVLLAYEAAYRAVPSNAAFSWTVRLRAILVGIWPYLLLSLAYAAVRMRVLAGFSHNLSNVPLRVELLTAPSLLWFYATQLAFPVRLSAFYDTPYTTQFDFLHVVLPALGLLAIAAGLWLWWRRTRLPTLTFASLLLVLPLLPLLHLSVFQPGDLAHDRYLYLPSIGFALLLAVALHSMPAGGRRILALPALPTAVFGALVLLYSAGVVSQSVYYADNLLLYYRGLTRAPNNNTVRMNLANELFQRGMPDQAIVLYQQVLQRDPNDWRTLYNLGYAYYRLHRYAEAESLLARSSSLNPLDPDSLFYLGSVRMELGKLQEAEAAFRAAVALAPRVRGRRYALGLTLEQQGRLPEALAAFKTELASYPDTPAARQHVTKIQEQMNATSSR